jgi:hypothetical protein
MTPWATGTAGACIPILQGGAKPDGGPFAINPGDSDEARGQKFFYNMLHSN